MGLSVEGFKKLSSGEKKAYLKKHPNSIHHGRKVEGEKTIGSKYKIVLRIKQLKAKAAQMYKRLHKLSGVVDEAETDEQHAKLLARFEKGKAEYKNLVQKIRDLEDKRDGNTPIKSHTTLSPAHKVRKKREAKRIADRKALVRKAKAT